MIDLTSCRYEYRERPCLIPGCKAEPTCFAHFPHHRGIGGKNAAWAYDHGVPLCFQHHEQLDGRTGTSKAEWAKHMQTLDIVTKLAPTFWARVRAEAEEAA